MESSVTTQRYRWLDVMKIISIFFVYAAHCEGMGRYGLLFSSLLVPSFFFCSGYTASRHENDELVPFIINKLQRIIWPYFMFGAVSLAVRTLIFELSLGKIFDWTRRLLYGCRANLPVAALWFLPCVFCMSIIYHILHKSIKNPALLLIICFAISASIKLIREEPVLPWGMDMAGRFIIYYALGDIAHACVDKKPFAEYKLSGKLVLTAVTAVCTYVTYVNFYFGRGYFASLLGVADPSYTVQSAEQFLFAVTGTWCVAVLSMLLQSVPSLASAGRYTLIFCGVEQLVKTLVPLMFSAFGLTLSNAGGAVMLLQSAGMLIIAYYTLALPITKYFPWVIGYFGKSGQNKSTAKDTVHS